MQHFTTKTLEVDAAPAFEELKQGKTEALQAYLDKGGDPDVKVSFGIHRSSETSLYSLLFELYCKDANKVRILLRKMIGECNGNPNFIMANSRTLAEKAVLLLDDWLVHFLIEKGADINNGKNGSLLKFAAFHQAHSIVFVLLEHYKADPNAANYSGETPLYNAAKKGNLGIVNMLIAAGADVNYNFLKDSPTVSALYVATTNGHAHVVERLLEAGAKPDMELGLMRQKTPLMACATRDDAKIADLLLAAGANATVQNGEGLTALHFACIEGAHRVVKSLLKTAPPHLIDMQDQKGMTAIHYAIKHNRKDVVLLLHRSGASPNVKENEHQLNYITYALVFSSSDIYLALRP